MLKQIKYWFIRPKLAKKMQFHLLLLSYQLCIENDIYYSKEQTNEIKQILRSEFGITDWKLKQQFETKQLFKEKKIKRCYLKSNDFGYIILVKEEHYDLFDVSLTPFVLSLVKLFELYYNKNVQDKINMQKQNRTHIKEVMKNWDEKSYRVSQKIKKE